jgi:hypothetical protein
LDPQELDQVFELPVLLFQYLAIPELAGLVGYLQVLV